MSAMFYETVSGFFDAEGDFSENLDEPTEAVHVNYPHEPGRLYDCPACEASCHCTPGTTECVWGGHES